MHTKWTSWVAVAGLLLAGVALAAPQHPGGTVSDGRSDATAVQPESPGTPADGADAWFADLLGSDDDAGEPAFDGEGSGGSGAGPGGWGMGGPGMVHRGMHRGRMGNGPGPQQMFAALDLTDAQRAKLADIHDRQARRTIGLRADLQLAGLDLRKLLRDDTPDRRAIDAQIEKIADLRGAMTKAQVAARLDARDVLTPEQLEKARTLHRGHDRGAWSEGGTKDSR